MGSLLPRRPEHEDVTQIPTPPLQKAAIFINFFFPALALVLVALRSYARIKTRQWGLGMLNILTADSAVHAAYECEKTC
ncbi:hypothetical protein IMZ48_11570 [Candidatus Bathyarchaeota archaeon]|nr:hypothetical protein [Candidatus Bathyarchaeota archaeon]